MLCTTSDGSRKKFEEGEQTIFYGRKTIFDVAFTSYYFYKKSNYRLLNVINGIQKDGLLTMFEERA